MQNFWHLSTGAKLLLALCAMVLLAEGLYINYIMGGAALNVLSKETSCERVLAKWEAAHPAESKPRPAYTGTIAPVNFNTPHPQAASFKGAIEEGVKQGGANFAGTYSVAQWGCGSNCQSHAVVNIVTGKIIAMGPTSAAGVGITPESNFLIVNPKENFPPPAEMQKASLETLLSLANLPREYYVLEGEGDTARLEKICTENPFEGVAL